MACLLATIVSLLFFTGLTSTQAFDAEIISDLMPSKEDERRALEIKADQFWQPVLQAVETIHLEEHLSLYTEVEAAIASLPAENEHVRELLTEVLMRLRRADEKVMLQALQSSDIATEEFLKGPGSAGGIFNFLTGGQDFFSLAIKRFVGLGRFSERLATHIQNRQDAILPALQGTATVAGNVLEDCRLASKLSFDVLKYDIYNKGVPKTPAAIKPLAYKLVDASGETRKSFMNMIMGVVGSITKDVEEKREDPSATVTKSLFGQGMHSSVQSINQLGKSSSSGDFQIFINAV